MTTPILNRDEFRAWLVAMGNQSVGNAWINCACPLAQFLCEKGFDSPRVHHTGIWIGNRQTIMPNWAQRFVSAVDNAFKKTGELIPGTAALAILDSVAI